MKAFGRSRGTLARTDRIDAELIARFMAFRPEAKADLRNGTAEPVEDLSGELLELLERQTAEVEERIGSLLANEAVLAETAAVLRSVSDKAPSESRQVLTRATGAYSRGSTSSTRRFWVS